MISRIDYNNRQNRQRLINLFDDARRRGEALCDAIKNDNLDQFRLAMQNTPILIHEETHDDYSLRLHDGDTTDYGIRTLCLAVSRGHLEMASEIISAIQESVNHHISYLVHCAHLHGGESKDFISNMMLNFRYLDWSNTMVLGAVGAHSLSPYWLLIKNKQIIEDVKNSIFSYSKNYIPAVSTTLKKTTGGDLVNMRIEDSCNRAIIYCMSRWTQRLKATLFTHMINTRDMNCNTPIDIAIDTNNIRMLNLLISANYDHGPGIVPRSYNLIRETPIGSVQKYYKDIRDTPLCKAIQVGNVHIVQMILDRILDVNQKEGRRLPIIEAIIKGDLQIFHMLIDKGATVKQDNDPTKACLAVAASFNRLLIAQELITKEVDVNQRMEIHGDCDQSNFRDHYNMTPLHYAAAGCHIEMIDLLLNHDANVEALDSKGCTPLDLALMRDHRQHLKAQLHIAKILMIKRGVNPYKHKQDDIDRHGRIQHWVKHFIAPTPVIHARIYKKLLDFTDEIFPCSQVNIREEFISLMQTAATFHELIDFIVKHNGNIHLYKHNEPTLLMMAVFLEDAKAIETLIKQGVDKDVTDGFSTALHQACRFSSPDIVTLLINQGCSPDCIDFQGYYPEKWALMAKKGNNTYSTMLKLKKNNRYLVKFGRQQPVNGKSLEESAEKLDIRVKEEKQEQEKYGHYIYHDDDFNDEIIEKILDGELELEIRFLQAVAKGDITDVRALLRAGVDINTPEAIYHRLDEFIVDGYMDGSLRDPQGCFYDIALHVAYRNNNIQMIRQLIVKGAKTFEHYPDPHVKKVREILDKEFMQKVEIYKRLFELIDKILPSSEDVKHKFIELFKKGADFSELISFIVRHKGTINLNQVERLNLLIMAITMENQEVIRKLIQEGGINKNQYFTYTEKTISLDPASNMYQYVDCRADGTILHLVNSKTYAIPSKILTTLLEQGCSLQALDSFGRCPELCAVDSRRHDNLKILWQFREKEKLPYRPLYKSNKNKRQKLR